MKTTLLTSSNLTIQTLESSNQSLSPSTPPTLTVALAQLPTAHA